METIKSFFTHKGLQQEAQKGSILCYQEGWPHDCTWENPRSGIHPGDRYTRLGTAKRILKALERQLGQQPALRKGNFIIAYKRGWFRTTYTFMPGSSPRD